MLVPKLYSLHERPDRPHVRAVLVWGEIQGAAQGEEGGIGLNLMTYFRKRKQNASDSRMRSVWRWRHHDVLRLLLRGLLQPEVSEEPLGHSQGSVLQALLSQGEPDSRKVNWNVHSMQKYFILNNYTFLCFT